MVNNSIDIINELKANNLITTEVHRVLLKTFFLHTAESNLRLLEEITEHQDYDLPGRKEFYKKTSIPALLKLAEEEEELQSTISKSTST